MPDEITLKLAFLTAVFIAASHFLIRYFRGNAMLGTIPTVGFSDPILSHLSAFQYIFDGSRMLKNGYEKATPGLFKVAKFRRWMVLATGSQLIDDIRRAPDNVLSNTKPLDELMQPEYTLDFLNANDVYHTDMVRSKLTRNIDSTFKEVHEELLAAVGDLIPTHEHKWITVPIQETIQRVICRTTNRIFVGTPLCRDYDYQTLNLTFAANAVKFGFIISLFPKPLKFIVSRMLSNLPSRIQQEIEFIRPMVEERFAKMEEYGEAWDDKPNDALMWLMSEAKGVERSVEGIRKYLGC
ncbi:hypothetical protein F5888DRAFT_1951995 [Russula emetica]|nr:hypothetical protein F5888DRAFT_1951995 [Russula emetica]